MKHKVGTIFRNDRLNAGGCPHLVVLLSVGREAGFEVAKAYWRCAHFQVSSSGLFGAQIVLFTEPELDSFERIGNISDILEKVDA